VTLSINSVGYGSSSGAVLSATHARVSAWRSRVPAGIEGPETEANISSMSILEGSAIGWYVRCM